MFKLYYGKLPTLLQSRGGEGEEGKGEGGGGREGCFSDVPL